MQRKWVYLAPIFGRGALPQQQARFRSVDEEFRRVMGLVEFDKKVASFAGAPRCIPACCARRFLFLSMHVTSDITASERLPGALSATSNATQATPEYALNS